ncbi:MAG: hypothetical protein RIS80_1281 [Actinomycetota bacterium]
MSVVCTALGVLEGIAHRTVLQEQKVCESVRGLTKQVWSDPANAGLVHQRQREIRHIANPCERDQAFDLVGRLVVLLPRVVEKQVVGRELLEFGQPPIRVLEVEPHMLDVEVGKEVAHGLFVAEVGIAR